MKALFDAVDVRTPEARPLDSMEDLQAGRMVARETLGNVARPIRRSIVDDEHLDVRVRHQPADEEREVVAFVEGGDDDQRSCGGGRQGRPSNRNDEICSVTKPTRIIMSLSS